MDSRRNFVRYNRTVSAPFSGERHADYRNGYPAAASQCDDTQQITAYTLAMVYAPVQQFRDLYDPGTALCYGTVFKRLNLPFEPGKRC